VPAKYPPNVKALTWYAWTAEGNCEAFPFSFRTGSKSSLETKDVWEFAGSIVQLGQTLSIGVGLGRWGIGCRLLRSTVPSRLPKRSKREME
jgi:hypothetical protein